VRSRIIAKEEELIPCRKHECDSEKKEIWQDSIDGKRIPAYDAFRETGWPVSQRPYRSWSWIRAWQFLQTRI
jgi:hypothetical protein